MCLNGIPFAMLMRNPSYLKQKPEELDESEISPLVSKHCSQIAPSVLNEHSHYKMTSNEESDMLPLVSKRHSHEHSKTKESEENETLPLIAKSGNSGDRHECCSAAGTAQLDGRPSHQENTERQGTRMCFTLESIWTFSPDRLEICDDLSLCEHDKSLTYLSPLVHPRQS